jgi:hypothetical protein
MIEKTDSDSENIEFLRIFPAHSIVVPMPGKVLIIRFFGVLLKTAVLKTMAFRIKLTTNYG